LSSSTRILAVSLLTVALSWGCSSARPGGPDAADDSGIGSVDGSGDGGSGSGISSAGDDGDGPIKLDIGGGASAGDDGGTEGQCKKIDFLFVIDNSGSMQNEQQALVASFPDFIDTIVDVTGAQDFQIMVVDSDSYIMPGAGQTVTCSGANCCDSWCSSFPAAICNNQPCSGPAPEPGSCDDTLGAGRTVSHNGQDCGIDSGFRYMLDSQANLPQVFGCAAEVGISGNGDEKVIEAMVTALSPEMNAQSECNEGFLRDDAVLVIVVITDEEDDHEGAEQTCMTPGEGSSGEPAGWHQAVVAAKKGAEQNAVVLSLIGPTDPGMSCPVLDKCAGGTSGAEPAPRIVDFTERFSRGLVGPVCAPNYDPFFSEAIGLIDTACQEFDPPG
jgi:hypothetical protein